jgi:phosphoglycerate dehydrogenase-like enzyme
MKNIWINRNLGKENLEFLQKRYPALKFRMAQGGGKATPDEAVRSAEVIFGWADDAVLEKAENLRWFHSVSAGVDTYIDAVDRIFGIKLLVSNSAGVYGIPISEHLLALMLSLVHRIGMSARAMDERRWGGLAHCGELAGATVGIVGFGDIGRHLAALLQPFRCEVLAFKRTPATKPRGVAEMLYGADGLDELMRRADHVCVCLPGTEETRGMIDGRRIALMKPAACLYNIGRGYIVDAEALVSALAAGRIAGAGLDVTDPEPLPPDHPLWAMKNVIVTPHMSGYTPGRWERRMTEFFAENLDAYIDGRPLPGAVDRVHKY